MNPKLIRWFPPLFSSFFFMSSGFFFYSPSRNTKRRSPFRLRDLPANGIAQSVKILGHRIPVMLISYLGALKSWVYAPIFRFWKPSAVSVRVPVILAAGLTVWLFWSLLRRIAGSRAASVGCVLLASDTLFLITSCFDWGPVVLQHLLLVSALSVWSGFTRRVADRSWLPDSPSGPGAVGQGACSPGSSAGWRSPFSSSLLESYGISHST